MYTFPRNINIVKEQGFSENKIVNLRLEYNTSAGDLRVNASSVQNFRGSRCKREVKVYIYIFFFIDDAIETFVKVAL